VRPPSGADLTLAVHPRRTLATSALWQHGAKVRFRASRRLPLPTPCGSKVVLAETLVLAIVVRPRYRASPFITEGRHMSFARIGNFEVPSHRMSELVELFRDQVTPTFAAHAGFLGYQAFTDVNAQRYVGVSYWASLAALEASSLAAREARDAASALGAHVVGEPLITREEFDTRISNHG
jgi:quinol monooxygenase YgiN